MLSLKNLHLKQRLEKIREQFNRLQKRQRTLALFLVAAILFSFYYNIIYKPQSSLLRRARAELISVNNRLQRLKSQIPDIDKEKDSLNAAKRSAESSKAQLAQLEAQLPRHGRIPELLGELVAQAAGYSVDFISIKPKTTREEKGYAELGIEIKFNSVYADFVNYLNRLESLSQFLKATNIAIEEAKDGFRGQLGVTLNFVTLLGEAEAGRREELRETKASLVFPVERSPFVSKFKPSKEGEAKAEFKVSGIIATGRQPTAIINDDVYRAGDMIGDRKIKEILPNMVILTDGKESTALTMER